MVEAADHQSFEHDVAHETVQLAWVPPLLVARVEPTTRTILTVVRSGRSGYRSALITRRADALTPTTLKGKRAVWTEPNSTAGYKLPLYLLNLLKQDTSKLFSETRFCGTYRAALLEVAEGRADVTAIYTPRTEEAVLTGRMRELIGELADSLHAIAFTEEVPADALVITSSVDRKTADDWSRVLLELPANHPLFKLLSAEKLMRARDGDYRYLRTAAMTRVIS